MRALIISDVHSNALALDAVLSKAPSFDEVWCLGDLTGYGPQPNECITTLLSLKVPTTVIQGNVDSFMLGGRPLHPGRASEAIINAAEWCKAHLTHQSIAYLRALPDAPTAAGRDSTFLLCHNSPVDYFGHPEENRPPDPLGQLPDKDTTPDALAANFQQLHSTYAAQRFCLVGHTHVPVLFSEGAGQGEAPSMLTPVPGEAYPLGTSRAIINPGSVGVPRDENPTASYAIYDAGTAAVSATITFYRQHYNLDELASQIRAINDPHMTAEVKDALITLFREAPRRR